MTMLAAAPSLTVDTTAAGGKAGENIGSFNPLFEEVVEQKGGIEQEVPLPGAVFHPGTCPPHEPSESAVTG
jgi:hypothetical protein